MIKILCPTDYSTHSKNALKYAATLSRIMGAELHLIAAYTIPTTASSMIKMDKIIVENRVSDLEKMLIDVQSSLKTSISATIDAIEGTAPSVILNYAKHHDIDLVVMGTQGSSNLKNILLGSVTRRVADSINVPLLAIPKDANVQTLMKHPILLALDSNEIVQEEHKFDVLKAIAEKTDNKIYILHVMRDAQDTLVDPFVVKLLEHHLADIVLKESLHPLVEINEYVSANDVSMLVMLKRKHSFLERLMLKGHTKQELELLISPLLILPDYMSA